MTEGDALRFRLCRCGPESAASERAACWAPYNPGLHVATQTNRGSLRRWRCLERVTPPSKCSPVRERENNREEVAAVSQGIVVTSSPAQVSRTQFAFPLVAAVGANAAAWGNTRSHQCRRLPFTTSSFFVVINILTIVETFASD